MNVSRLRMTARLPCRVPGVVRGIRRLTILAFAIRRADRDIAVSAAGGGWRRKRRRRPRRAPSRDCPGVGRLLERERRDEAGGDRGAALLVRRVLPVAERGLDLATQVVGEL